MSSTDAGVNTPPAETDAGVNSPPAETDADDDASLTDDALTETFLANVSQSGTAKDMRIALRKHYDEKIHPTVTRKASRLLGWANLFQRDA